MKRFICLAFIAAAVAPVLAQQSFTPPKNEKIPPADPYVAEALQSIKRHSEWADIKMSDGTNLRAWVVYPESSTKTGVVTVLDLGANVNCTPLQLVQFAVMGSALAAAVEQIERPTVGLLNIGEEDIKGNETVKQTAELLKRSGLNFHGNVEGDDIYKGTTDVVVCDGFVGNVMLKTSEGLAAMLYESSRPSSRAIR